MKKIYIYLSLALLLGVVNFTLLFASSGTWIQDTASDWGTGSGINIDTATYSDSVAMANKMFFQGSQISIASNIILMDGTGVSHPNWIQAAQPFYSHDDLIISAIKFGTINTQINGDITFNMGIANSNYDFMVSSKAIRALSNTVYNIPISDTNLLADTTYYILFTTNTGGWSYISNGLRLLSSRGNYWGKIIQKSSGIWNVSTFKIYFELYCHTLSSYYSSQILNAGNNWYSWGNFNVSDNRPVGSSISYFVRTSTSPDNLSARPLVSVSNGNLISSSVGPYIQLIASFTRTDVSVNPKLNNFSINWNYTNPQIAWTGESAFINTAVYPSTGNAKTQFEYRVKYQDDYPPAPGYPKINVLKHGTTVQSFSANYASGNYTSGAIYSTSTLLSPCSYYSYTIQACDQWNLFSTTTLRGSGPDVGYKISGHVYYPDESTLFPFASVKIVEIATRTYTTGSDGYYELAGTSKHNWILSASSSPAIGSVSFYPETTMFSHLSTNTSQDIKRINTAPSLGWVGSVGKFMTDGADPELGTSTMTYTFKVKYMDTENDVPLSGYPRVVIKKGLSVVKTIPMVFDSGQSGSTYASGIIFTTSTQLTPEIYSYYFEAKDRWGLDGTGVATGQKTDAIDVKARINIVSLLPDGSPMANVKLDLTGAANSTKYTSSLGSATFYYLNTGVNYNLTPSSHAYYYFSPANVSYSPLSDDKVVTFTRINRSSTTFTGEAGYETEGINPEIDTIGGVVFTYRCKYVDADNDPPAAGYPKVRILKGGTTVYDVSMTAVDSSVDYISGKKYYYQTTLPAGINYSYYFAGRDKFGMGSRTPGLAGPVVSTGEPELSYLGTAGYVTDALEPADAVSGTTFFYLIKYTSMDGVAPKSGYPRLFVYNQGRNIHGSPFSMIKADTLSYTQGTIYGFSVLLSTGIGYSYKIDCLDAYGNASNEIIGTGPKVLSSISGYVKDPNSATMANIEVKLLNSTTNQAYVTQNNGYFEFLVSTASYKLYVSSPSYYMFNPSSYTIFNTQNNTKGFSFGRAVRASNVNCKAITKCGADMNIGKLVALPGETVRFDVVYKDPDKDALKASYPKVFLYKGGLSAYSTVQVLTMGYVSGNIDAGIVFSTSTVLSLPGVYSYIVKAYDVYDSFVSSGINTAFYVCYTEAPSKPENNTSKAKENAIVTNAKVRISWNPCNTKNGNVIYKLFLSDPYDSLTPTPAFTGTMLASAGINTNEVYSGSDPCFELESLVAGKAYSWFVKAKDEFGFETTSDIYSFKTLPIENAVKAFNYPNPFNPAKGQNTNIVFNMASAGSAELKIYSELGDTCWSTNIDSLNAGVNEVSYDGKDANGRLMYNGTYPCVINKKYTNGTEKDKCRILIIK